MFHFRTREPQASTWVQGCSSCDDILARLANHQNKRVYLVLAILTEERDEFEGE